MSAAAGFARSLDLSAWRGRSGRRYVVGVRPLDEIMDVTDAVVLGVRRGADGLACIVKVARVGHRASEGSRAGWLSALKAKGATELHVHRLAETDADRRAIVEDLRNDEDGGTTGAAPGRGGSGRFGVGRRERRGGSA